MRNVRLHPIPIRQLAHPHVFTRSAFLSVTLVIALLGGLILPVLPAAAQDDDCEGVMPARLFVGVTGFVTFSDGRPLNVRTEPALAAAQVAQLDEGARFDVVDGEVCADAIRWWRIESGDVNGWIAEGQDGEYFVAPLFAGSGDASTTAFAAFDWEDFSEIWYKDSPDPRSIALPAAYAGDLPDLPVDLSGVQFVDDAGLNDAQRALLAQNGFVVVPGGFDQFHRAYHSDDVWRIMPENYKPGADPQSYGYSHAFFITTDATLHALHFIFDNLLTDLEIRTFYDTATFGIVIPALNAAHDQSVELAGTPLADSAVATELYLAVAAELLMPGSAESVVSPDVMAQVSPLVDSAVAAEGRLEVPFLPGYTEDFSQYKPRGHYEGDPVLERYFRGMMWLGRITFRASEPAETRIALLTLRALQNAPGALAQWYALHEMLTFLIGPVDDLGPQDYAPLMSEVYGAATADRLADPALLTVFQEAVKSLPGPRVNSLVLPIDTPAEDVEDLGRGFRLMGQRFTFDAYVMQQLIAPEVGTLTNPRALPLGLDVPASLGSEEAYALADEMGATAYENYDAQMEKMRTELAALEESAWLENTYGGWLYSLQPLWVRDSAPYPPVMNTQAWLRKDLQTGLASWTELKHDTVLYVKQPAGLGGGGAPLTSFGYVEPNPLVFARIATVAAMTYQGLITYGLNPEGLYTATPDPALVDMDALRELAIRSAELAEMARKELNGEPLEEDNYWFILGFGGYLQGLLYRLNTSGEDPDPVALVTDVASNPGLGVVLQGAVGPVDMIYVAVPLPDGTLQVVRGGVFSYYEFTQPIDQRMTDSEWRALVAEGNLPPRPDWISAFYAE